MNETQPLPPDPRTKPLPPDPASTAPSDESDHELVTVTSLKEQIDAESSIVEHAALLFAHNGHLSETIARLPDQSPQRLSPLYGRICDALLKESNGVELATQFLSSVARDGGVEQRRHQEALGERAYEQYPIANDTDKHLGTWKRLSFVMQSTPTVQIKQLALIQRLLGEAAYDRTLEVARDIRSATERSRQVAALIEPSISHGQYDVAIQAFTELCDTHAYARCVRAVRYQLRALLDYDLLLVHPFNLETCYYPGADQVSLTTVDEDLDEIAAILRVAKPQEIHATYQTMQITTRAIERRLLAAYRVILDLMYRRYPNPDEAKQETERAIALLPFPDLREQATNLMLQRDAKGRERYLDPTNPQSPSYQAPDTQELSIDQLLADEQDRLLRDMENGQIEPAEHLYERLLALTGGDRHAIITFARSLSNRYEDSAKSQYNWHGEFINELRQLEAQAGGYLLNKQKLGFPHSVRLTELEEQACLAICKSSGRHFEDAKALVRAGHWQEAVAGLGRIIDPFYRLHVLNEIIGMLPPGAEQSAVNLLQEAWQIGWLLDAAYDAAESIPFVSVDRRLAIDGLKAQNPIKYLDELAKLAKWRGNRKLSEEFERHSRVISSIYEKTGKIMFIASWLGEQGINDLLDSVQGSELVQNLRAQLSK